MGTSTLHQQGKAPGVHGFAPTWIFVTVVAEEAEGFRLRNKSSRDSILKSCCLILTRLCSVMSKWEMDIAIFPDPKWGAKNRNKVGGGSHQHLKFNESIPIIAIMERRYILFPSVPPFWKGTVSLPRTPPYGGVPYVPCCPVLQRDPCEAHFGRLTSDLTVGNTWKGKQGKQYGKTHMGVSKNRGGPPKSSILVRFFPLIFDF